VQSVKKMELHHFPFRPARVLSLIADDPLEEKGRKFMRLLRDLIAGEPTDDPISGPMIEEAREYFLAKRRAGQKGGSTTQARRAQASTDKSPPNQCLGTDQAIKDNSIEPNPRLQDTPLPPRGGVSVTDEGFDRFWKVYPKKLAKGDAKMAWRKTRGIRPPTDELVAALEAQKKTSDWAKNNGQFIPHPARWLRASGWENDISSMNTGGLDNENNRRMQDRNSSYKIQPGRVTATGKGKW
jgi:hypothetical protein